MGIREVIGGDSDFSYRTDMPSKETIDARRYYNSDSRDYRATRTNQVRFKLLKKAWRKEPLLILQMEETHEVKKTRGGNSWWDPIEGTRWRDATLEDMSVMDMVNLTMSREGGEYPVCFRPMRYWGEWKLVLQILQGNIGTNTWADARMTDLLFKEGKILGGVGLVTR